MKRCLLKTDVKKDFLITTKYVHTINILGYLLEKIKEMLPSQSCIPSWKKGSPNTSNLCRNHKLNLQKVQCSYSNRFRVMYKPSKGREILHAKMC